MSYIYELVKSAESSFTDCGVFAYDAEAVVVGAIRNVSLAVHEPYDRPWKRLQYYRSVDTNMRAVLTKHGKMWEQVPAIACSDRNAAEASDEAPPLTSHEKSFSAGHSKPGNPLHSEESLNPDYDKYDHIFSKVEIAEFHQLHARAMEYMDARRALKTAEEECRKPSKKNKRTPEELARAVDAKAEHFRAARTKAHETFEATLPKMFEAFRRRYLAAVNELRVCFKLTPELIQTLEGQPQSLVSGRSRDSEERPENVAAAPLQDVDGADLTSTETVASPTSVNVMADISVVESGGGEAVLHSTEQGEEKTVKNKDTCEVWFRFFYFDRLKSATEKLSLGLSLALLHFTRLEKKYDYAYPPELKAKMRHMMEVLNGYSWEKHRQRFDSILRDMFHYRKNLEHLRWATEELNDLDRKIKKHSGDVIKRKLRKYTERRAEVKKDIEQLTTTLFNTGADEMLRFYDALLTVVIKSLNDLVHLLHGTTQSPN